jgi:hypothetical protein
MRKLLALCGLIALLAFGSLCTPASPPPSSDESAITGQHGKGDPSIKVWVNTPTKVYHCPGTRWYGATKNGEYMTQKEAQDKGNRPAYGKYCE